MTEARCRHGELAPPLEAQGLEGVDVPLSDRLKLAAPVVVADVEHEAPLGLALRDGLEHPHDFLPRALVEVAVLGSPLEDGRGVRARVAFEVVLVRVTLVDPSALAPALRTPQVGTL